jgi:hypothetical protein
MPVNVGAFCWSCLNNTAFTALSMSNVMFIERLLSLHVTNNIKEHCWVNMSAVWESSKNLSKIEFILHSKHRLPLQRQSVYYDEGKWSQCGLRMARNPELHSLGTNSEVLKHLIHTYIHTYTYTHTHTHIHTHTHTVRLPFERLFGSWTHEYQIYCVKSLCLSVSPVYWVFFDVWKLLKELKILPSFEEGECLCCMFMLYV